MVLQNLSCIAVGLILAMTFSWKLTLLIMSFIPVVMLTAAVESRVFSGATASDRTAMEKAGKVDMTFDLLFTALMPPCLGLFFS